MARHWLISAIAVAVSSIFAFLIGVYSEQIREMISSATGLTDATVVFYFVLGAILLIFVVSLSYIALMIYTKFFKFDVIIQKESFCFNKYPYLVGSRGRIQVMTNMSYSEVTIQNCGKTKVNDCSLEITLRKEDKDVKSKVLSSDSTREPNPMDVSIDGEGRIGFHPVCLSLHSFEAFLPNHSLKVAGSFSGTLIPHGEYETLAKVIYDGKLGKLTSLGQIKIPDDFVNKAKIPNDIQVIIDQGGFAVYAELFQGKVRAKFFGHFTNGDVKRTLKALSEQNFQVDLTVEENGKLRKISDGKDAWVFG